jgi:hypothetical protein
MFFIKHPVSTAGVKGSAFASGVCVSKKTFDDFIQDKFIVSDQVVQPVKLAGVAGIQLNDAEMVLQEATTRTLNLEPASIAVRYADDTHQEIHDQAPSNHAQLLYLPESPSRFEIEVRCQQSNQQCNLVQMELLAALRDRKTQFNEVLRRVSGKETAYVAASGMPAVTSLSADLGSSLQAAERAASATNLFFAVAAGVAMTMLGFVAFIKLRRRQDSVCSEPQAATSFSREALAADQEPLTGSE